MSVTGDRTRIRDIEYFIFFRDRQTIGKNSPSVDQLQCLDQDPVHCPLDAVFPSAQCFNQGVRLDGSVLWACEADLKEIYSLSKVEIHCESFDGDNDEYVVTGSCAMIYSLDYTPKFNFGFGLIPGTFPSSSSSSSSRHVNLTKRFQMVSIVSENYMYLIFSFFFAIAFVIIRRYIHLHRQRSASVSKKPNDDDDDDDERGLEFRENLLSSSYDYERARGLTDDAFVTNDDDDDDTTTSGGSNRDLPIGWERCLEKRTRRIFYVNHCDQTTTYDHPNMAKNMTTSGGLSSSSSRQQKNKKKKVRRIVRSQGYDNSNDDDDDLSSNASSISSTSSTSSSCSRRRCRDQYQPFHDDDDDENRPMVSAVAAMPVVDGIAMIATATNV